MRSVLKVFWNLLFIFIGTVIIAAAIKGILIPNQFLAGGIPGVAVLIHFMFPKVPVGLIFFVLNVPTFIIGWKFVGRRFFLYSLAGMSIFSVVLLWPYLVIPIHDMILCALTAGIMIGVGSGIVLRSFGSIGSLGILSVIFFKRFSIRPGNTILAFNVLLLISGAFRIPLEMVLYTLIHLYVSRYAMNSVVTGLSQRKSVMIISSKWKKISQKIMTDLERGVTILSGKGGFTDQKLQVLYAVVTFSELVTLKEIIRKLDSSAFVVVTETLEIMGKKIGNQPHW